MSVFGEAIVSNSDYGGMSAGSRLSRAVVSLLPTVPLRFVDNGLPPVATMNSVLFGVGVYIVVSMARILP